MKNNVRRLRIAMGLRPSELAQRLGVSERSVYRWEAREYDPSPMAQQKFREVVHERRIEVEQQRADQRAALRANRESSAQAQTQTPEQKDSAAPDEGTAENGPVRRGF